MRVLFVSGILASDVVAACEMGKDQGLRGEDVRSVELVLLGSRVRERLWVGVETSFCLHLIACAHQEHPGQTEHVQLGAWRGACVQADKLNITDTDGMALWSPTPAHENPSREPASFVFDAARPYMPALLPTFF